MKAKFIPCALHDYIEIACLYRYQVKLQLTHDESIQGRAVTTETSASKGEFLVLATEGQVQRIELLRIKSLQALTRNPYFDCINFDEPRQ